MSTGFDSQIVEMLKSEIRNLTQFTHGIDARVKTLEEGVRENDKQISSFRGNFGGFNIPGVGSIPPRIKSWVSDLENKMMKNETNLAPGEAEIKQLKLCVPAATGPSLVPEEYAVQGSYISTNIAGNNRWGTAKIGG